MPSILLMMANLKGCQCKLVVKMQCFLGFDLKQWAKAFSVFGKGKALTGLSFPVAAASSVKWEGIGRGKAFFDQCVGGMGRMVGGRARDSKAVLPSRESPWLVLLLSWSFCCGGADHWMDEGHLGRKRRADKQRRGRG